MSSNQPLPFKNRVERNAPGPYYVTSNCTDCGLCYAEAKAIFRHDNIVHKAYVFKQPATGAERTAAETMAHRCPEKCIHDNGNKFSRPAAPSPGKHSA